MEKGGSVLGVDDIYKKIILVPVIISIDEQQLPLDPQLLSGFGKLPTAPLMPGSRVPSAAPG